MSDTAISVEGLGKRYDLGAQPHELLRNFLIRCVRGGSLPERYLAGEFWALRDISFEVTRGEILGVIGRNGAGKSTLLKLLSRVVSPSEGVATIHGRVGSLLEVGTGFHPELTGRENVFLNGAILGMRRREILDNFDDIVDFAGIGRFLDTPVKRYSSGMRVRLGFAVAAHLQPEILIIDEVLAVGDAAFQKRCLGKMQDIASHGRTILFVSHSMGSIADLCTRCILLDSGRIAREGETGPVIRAYLDEHAMIGEIDLRGWDQDRHGDGPMRLTYMKTVDISGDVSSRFLYQDKISFLFGIEGRVGTCCTIGISIRTEDGHLILHLNNIDDKAHIELCDDETHVTLTVPSILLNDGKYIVSVWLGDDLNTLHDRVGDALAFQVESVVEGSVRCQAPVRMGCVWSACSQMNRCRDE